MKKIIKLLAAFWKLASFWKGGLISDLADELQAFNSEFGGAWSLTIVQGRSGQGLEVNLLRVGLQRPSWRGPGFRKPRKNAPEKAIIEAKFIFQGPPEMLIPWLKETREINQRKNSE